MTPIVLQLLVYELDYRLRERRDGDDVCDTEVSGRREYLRGD